MTDYYGLVDADQQVSALLAVKALGVAWQTKQQYEAVSFFAMLFSTPAGMLLLITLLISQ